MSDLMRVCIDCGDVANGTRCPSCRAEATRKQNQRRAAAGTLGAPWAWRDKSRAIRRAQPQCVECGSSADLTADHIRPRSLGGNDGVENLRTLCRSCNAKKGAL